MDTRLGQMRSSKIAFEWTEKHFILCGIEQGIIKEPTVMVPNPIEPHRQLALTPGSTHDARLLRHCSLFRTICNGGGIPNKSVTLGMEI